MGRCCTAAAVDRGEAFGLREWPRIGELLQPLFKSIFSAIEVHEEATFDDFVRKTSGFKRLHLVWIRGHCFW